MPVTAASRATWRSDHGKWRRTDSGFARVAAWSKKHAGIWSPVNIGEAALEEGNGRNWSKRAGRASPSSTSTFTSIASSVRKLCSEAIRLLLPLTGPEDLDTLMASLYLGLRLRFEGDPAHLLLASQTLPDPGDKGERHYLVLMDAVPGGTGYLKSLYQQKDTQGRMGEG